MISIRYDKPIAKGAEGSIVPGHSTQYVSQPGPYRLPTPDGSLAGVSMLLVGGAAFSLTHYGKVVAKVEKGSAVQVCWAEGRWYFFASTDSCAAAAPEIARGRAVPLGFKQPEPEPEPEPEKKKASSKG